MVVKPQIVYSLYFNNSFIFISDLGNLLPSCNNEIFVKHAKGKLMLMENINFFFTNRNQMRAPT